MASIPGVMHLFAITLCTAQRSSLYPTANIANVWHDATVQAMCLLQVPGGIILTSMTTQEV